MSRNLLIAGIIGCLLAGCSAVGPTAIRSGRLAYNEAITETNSQQMLMVVIRNRYEESSSLLSVASVTANVRVTTSVGLQAGFGNNDNYSGNLTPFSAGAVYEENPTISYLPVAGKKYLRQVMAPVSIGLLAQLADAMTDPAPVYAALVSRVNGIDNPDFLSPPEEADPRFMRFVSLMTKLNRARRLHWVEDSKQAGAFSVVIDRSVPGYAAEIEELLRLLGLPTPQHRSPRLVLPVSLALDGSHSGGIGITTRSVFDMVEIMSAAVDIPDEDRRNSVVATYPPPGLAGRFLRVRRAADRPEHASVAVNYRGGWFYIDERDQLTKRFFRLLDSLWSVTMAESTAAHQSAPVLTVPVSR